MVLATAALGVDPQVLTAALHRLGFAAGRRDLILAATGRGPTLAGALAGARTPSQIAAAADRAPVEAVALAGALADGGPGAAAARRWLGELRHVGLEIDGTDLLSASVPAGPAVGRGLRAALAAKLDGMATGREQELAAAVAGASGPEVP
jgi:tRNA nucleotidyltransferase (CCA-adding enzyme)